MSFRIFYCEPEDRISVEVHNDQYFNKYLGKITIKVSDIGASTYNDWIHLRKNGEQVQGEILINIVLSKQKLLKKACKMGNLDAVQELLADTSIDPGHNNNEALIAAVVCCKLNYKCRSNDSKPRRK
jgi:hypothetical protein